ncbi:hypothetical protein EDB19DRAFT_1726403, partial [Suillus lakei]
VLVCALTIIPALLPCRCMQRYPCPPSKQSSKTYPLGTTSPSNTNGLFVRPPSFQLVQMFMLGPCLILSVRESNAESARDQL